MKNARWIVVTTINPPTETVRRIAELCPEWQILVVGDRKTPHDWHYPGVRFLSVDEQQSLPFAISEHLPYNHYARKNLGYLYAIAHGAEVLMETDDDNLPYDWYPGPVSLSVHARKVESSGWHNVYRHFSSARIWPRGFPLELVNESLRTDSQLSGPVAQDCAIQQFLADENPDVDAVYRLTAEGDIFFRGEDVALGSGSWCPFNSQNTLWWPAAFPYLYLPCSATFRMTDIWRSFVAQVCLFASGGHLAFRGANMFQRRNDHSLIRDFADEVSGYLNNVAIMEKLSRLPLDGSDPAAQLHACYEAMTSAGYLRSGELQLASLWLADLKSAREQALASKADTPVVS